MQASASSSSPAAAVAAAAAIAHSIHVGLLPGLLLKQGWDGSSALIFKGKGHRVEEEEMHEMHETAHLSVGSDALQN